MGVVAPIVGLVISATATGASVAQGVSAERRGRRTRREAEAAQGRITAEAFRQESEAQREAGRIAARRAQAVRRTGAAAGGGRRSTIVTGPLGIPPTGQEAGGKQLLGL
jgi:hypothetical protein